MEPWVQQIAVPLAVRLYCGICPHELVGYYFAEVT